MCRTFAAHGSVQDVVSCDRRRTLKIAIEVDQLSRLTNPFTQLCGIEAHFTEASSSIYGRPLDEKQLNPVSTPCRDVSSDGDPFQISESVNMILFTNKTNYIGFYGYFVG